MSLGKSLLIALALLAYLGQSLAYAGSACEAMDGADTGTQHVAMMDSEHMHHDMAAAPPVAEHSDNCCDTQCQCVGEGCHSPIPAMASTSDAQVFSAVVRSQQQVLRTISTSFYLYKPPILS